MSSTAASEVTVISLQDASKVSNTSPVKCQSVLGHSSLHINHVLRRRSIEIVRSADAVVTGKVVRTLSSEIKRNVAHSRFFLLYDQGL